MKKFILLGIMALAFFATQNTFGQKSYHPAIDTLTNSETTYYEYPEALDGDYYIQWNINTTNLSGTTASTVYRETTTTTAGSTTSGNWGYVQKMAAVSSAADTVWNGQVYGLRERIKIVQTGSSTTKYEISAKPVKKR